MDVPTIQIQVVKPGWFSTVQDLGRYGYQQYGVPVAGAAVITADLPLAAQLAPGDTVTLALTTIAKAQAALRKQRVSLDAAFPSQFHATSNN